MYSNATWKYQERERYELQLHFNMTRDHHLINLFTNQKSMKKNYHETSKYFEEKI